MSHPKLWLLIAVVWLAGTAPSWADQPRWLFDGCRWYKPPCRSRPCQQCGSVDDYCPKPLPPIRCNDKGRYDDYCPKPLPRVPCNARGCVDDYCPRPCPIRWPCWWGAKE